MIDHRSAQAFTPCAIVAVRWLRRDDVNPQSNILNSPIEKDRLSAHFPKLLLAIITVSAVAALSPPYVGSSAFALCLCSILLSSLAYTLLEDVLFPLKSGPYDVGGSHAAINGTSSPRRLSNPFDSPQAVLQNLSATIALGCAVASIFLEEHRVDGLTYRRELSLLGDNWKRDMRQLDFGQGFAMCIVGALQGFMTVSAVSRSKSTKIQSKLLLRILILYYTVDYVLVIMLHYSRWSLFQFGRSDPLTATRAVAKCIGFGF